MKSSLIILLLFNLCTVFSQTRFKDWQKSRKGEFYETSDQKRVRIKNYKTIKKEFHKIEIGDSIKIPLSIMDTIKHKTSIALYFSNDSSIKYDCIMYGVVKDKKIRKQRYLLILLPYKICDYNEVYLNDETKWTIGKQLNYDMKHLKVILK